MTPPPTSLPASSGEPPHAGATPTPGAAHLGAMERAIEQRRTLQKPVHLRLSFALPGDDPWALLGTDQTETWSAFHDAVRRVSVWTEGIAWKHETGTSDIDSIRNAAAAFAEGFLEASRNDDSPRLPPIFFGGQQFACGTQSGNWAHWPGSAFFVPRLMIWDSPGGLRAYLVNEVREEDDVATLWDRFAAPLARAEERLKTPPHALAPPVDVPCDERPLETRDAWMQRVEEARRAIETSPLHKVVLVRAITSTAAQPPCPYGTLRRLRIQNPNCTVFGVSLSPGETFLGATPETLITIAGRVLSSHAVAGTAPRGHDAREDARIGESLLHSVKDRMEHEVVTHVLATQLSAHCEQIEVARQPVLLKLPAAQHLNSPISGWVQSHTHILDVVETLHPTPALGGAPAAEAAQWLEEHEALCRGWFGAPIGWFDLEGDGHFAVSIRSAWMNAEEVVSFAGAGIVHGSRPDLEWQETELKLSTIRNALTHDGGGA